MLHGSADQIKDEDLFDALLLADKYEVSNFILTDIRNSLTTFIKDHLQEAIQYLDRMDKLLLSSTFNGIRRACLKKLLSHVSVFDNPDGRATILSLPFGVLKQVLKSDISVASENTGINVIYHCCLLILESVESTYGMACCCKTFH
jgi:hypothetical protein